MRTILRQRRQKMKRNLRFVVVTLLPALVLALPVSAQILYLYSILPESFAGQLFDAFTEATRTKSNFVRHSAGEVLARLIAERNNPRVAMVFGGPADTFAAAVSEGVLEAYAPAGVEAIPALYRDSNNYFTGIALNPI